MIELNSFLNDIFNCINESKIKKYSNSEAGEMVASGKIKPSGRISKEFIQKALWNDESTWYVLEDDEGEVLSAITAVEVEGSLLIEEFMSFQKGSGAELLLYVLSLDYNMIYMFADWSQPESLLEYYRDKKFGLTERTMKNSPDHDTHYFYLNKKLSHKELEKFIDRNFIV